MKLQLALSIYVPPLEAIRGFEKVESPKTDSPDLTPEGLGGPRGPKGALGGPKYILKTVKTMKIFVLLGFGEIPPLFSLLGP